MVHPPPPCLPSSRSSLVIFSMRNGELESTSAGDSKTNDPATEENKLFMMNKCYTIVVSTHCSHSRLAGKALNAKSIPEPVLKL